MVKLLRIYNKKLTRHIFGIYKLLSDDDIKTCNYILKLPSTRDNDSKIEAISESTIYFKYKNDAIPRRAISLLKEEKLIYSNNPLRLSTYGARYSKKGIERFLINKRSNELFNSPLLKFWILFIPVLINSIYNVISYRDKQQVERHSIENNYSQYCTDSTFEYYRDNIYKNTVSDSVTNDRIDSIFYLIENHNNDTLNVTRQKNPNAKN